MKLMSVWVKCAVLLALVSGNAMAWDDTEEVEINVESLLAPAVGFDDNDNVQVVLHGYLPNTCYTLGRYSLEYVNGGTEMKVRQFAIRKEDGVCAQGAEMPPHMQMAVPFTAEAPIGRLKVGDYKFDYQSVGGKDRTRALAVSKATTTHIDSKPYAAVTNVIAPDLADVNSEIKVTLSGVLNSTCTEIDDVKVERQDDTFVVLPTIKVRPGVFCAQMLIPFVREVNIGRAKLGHTLVHVRSMNGSAVNRVVEVFKR